MSNHPSDFEIEVDNITADSIADGECTWCEYDISGDGTDVSLVQRCEFHNRKDNKNVN